MSNLSTSEMTQLKVIEDEVNEYLRSRQNNPKTATGINSAMNRVIPRALMPTKKINIIWNDTARSPFIMSITPDISELYEKSEKINQLMNDPKSRNADVIKEWADIDQWYIEIDTRVLTKGNRLCVDDGAQFVALLCHEIGHVMNENPMRLFYNYKYQSLQFSTMEKLMLSNSKIVRAIMLPMYTHTLQFMIVVKDRNDSRKCEMAADMYVPDMYKGALVSYMNDHILMDPQASKLVIDEDSFDKEQNVGIKLSKESIEMLKGRRDALNMQIQNQYNSQDNGIFHRHLMKFIGRKMTGYDPEEDKYITGLKTMMENAYQREYATMESKAVSVLTEAAKVTSRELDILDIRADNIATPEDKMYIIQRVYDYMEAIDSENAKKIKKDKSGNLPKEIKDTRLDRLNAIRTKVLATKVEDPANAKYGIVVKYPSGYEG
jgi:hypothetical protein